MFMLVKKKFIYKTQPELHTVKRAMQYDHVRVECNLVAVHQTPWAFSMILFYGNSIMQCSMTQCAVKWCSWVCRSF